MYSRLGGYLGVTTKFVPLASKELLAWVKGWQDKLMTHISFGSFQCILSSLEGECLGDLQGACLGNSTVSLGRSVTCLGRAGCLGESAASLGLSICTACIPPWLGVSAAYLGRIVNCLEYSTVCLGMSPQLGTSIAYLRRAAC